MFRGCEDIFFFFCDFRSLQLFNCSAHIMLYLIESPVERYISSVLGVNVMNLNVALNGKEVSECVWVCVCVCVCVCLSVSVSVYMMSTECVNRCWQAWAPIYRIPLITEMYATWKGCFILTTNHINKWFRDLWFSHYQKQTDVIFFN